MLRAVLLVAGASATLGTALAVGTGLGAQTVDGLDLRAVRERARLDPETAKAFEDAVLHRGRSFQQAAESVANEAKAGQAKLAGASRASDGSAGPFDFDAMIAAAASGAVPDDMPRLVAFASLSMPETSLRQVIADVSKVGGVVVFRGFPGNSARRFTAALSAVLPQGKVRASVGIDPRLFRAFNVAAVPAYIVTATGFDLCDGFDCRTTLPPHDRIAGNVTLDYALAAIGDGDGPAAKVARVYQHRLMGDAR